MIDSRNTDLGFFQYLIRYYGERVKRNHAAPKELRQAFDNVVRDLQGEIQYFNQEIANRDARSVEQLYNKSGFHWTKVTYKYGRDSVSLIKTLTFEVAEGDQALLDTVVYAGVDSLPEPVLKGVFKTKTYAPGNIYSEEEIQKNINAAFTILQDSGYYYAKFAQPFVTVLSETKSDSVFTQFTPGKQQRISQILLTDSLNGQSAVSLDMRRLQLEFHEGEWYNRSAIQQSIKNLYELTTFDVVSIDTIATGDNSDTTISLEVLLRYRKQNELSPAVVLNRTTIDNFVNLGFDVTYTNRNIFGAAQNLTLFVRPQLLDLSRAAVNKPKDYDWELQTGLQYSQPYIFNWLNARWSYSFNYLFSYRYLVRPLQLRTHYFRPTTFTAQFAKPIPIFGVLDNAFNTGVTRFFKGFDVYDQLILDASIESQKPVRYDSTERKYRSNTLKPEEERAIIENLYIYKQLNDYPDFWSSLILSTTFIGDRRNDFFVPSNGFYSTIAVDWGTWLSKFTRGQFLLTYFHPTFNKFVFAYKARWGNIWWRDIENSYVPFERHFFAGGSNSVRGWPSRELRAPLQSDTTQLNNELRILQDITGSGTLLEGSFEARYSFGKQKTYFLSSIVSEMGIVGFIDVGNTFNRLTPEAYKVDFSGWDYITKLGWAAGLGLRYNTPVGPLRLDVATRLYDPALQSTNFKHIQVHVGLGHAF